MLFIFSLTFDEALAKFSNTWTWTNNGGGSWSQGSNWSSNPTAPSSGTVAFGSVITWPVTVTLDGPQSVGALVFNNLNGYTLATGNDGVH